MYDFFNILGPLSMKTAKKFHVLSGKNFCVISRIFLVTIWNFWKCTIFFFCSSNGTSCYYWSKLSRFRYNGNGVVGDSRGDWIILRQSACGSFSLYPGSPGNFLLAKALTEKKKKKNYSNNPTFKKKPTLFLNFFFRKF